MMNLAMNFFSVPKIVCSLILSELFLIVVIFTHAVVCCVYVLDEIN